MTEASRPDASSTSLRRLRHRLIIVLIFYFIAGSVSQKLLPGVDEIFPLFGWSLFSTVPNHSHRYSVLVHEHNGLELEPPLVFLQAPDSVMTGNRYIATKVVRALGAALDRGDAAEAERHRRMLEETYFLGSGRYEIVFESFDPLEKWRTGDSRVRRSLGEFQKAKGPRRRSG